MPLPSILFVDDDERVLRSLQSIFRRTYRVLTTTRAKEALDILQSESVDIVVSDQRMPEVTGDELLKQIALEHPQIVRILLTGYADASVTIDAVSEGTIYSFITKPWDYDEIKSTMADALAFSKNPIEKHIEPTSAASDNDVVEEIDEPQPEPAQQNHLNDDSHSLSDSHSEKPLPALLIEYSQSIRNTMRLKCRRLKCTLYSVSAQRHIPGMLRIRPDISVLIVGLENKVEAVQIVNSVKEQNPNIVAIGLTENSSTAQYLLQQGVVFALIDPAEDDEEYLNTVLAASEHYRQLLLANAKANEKGSRTAARKSKGFNKIKNILNDR